MNDLKWYLKKRWSHCNPFPDLNLNPWRHAYMYALGWEGCFHVVTYGCLIRPSIQILPSLNRSHDVRGDKTRSMLLHFHSLRFVSFSSVSLFVFFSLKAGPVRQLCSGRQHGTDGTIFFLLDRTKSRYRIVLEPVTHMSNRNGRMKSPTATPF
jgi:hypothetical protein